MHVLHICCYMCAVVNVVMYGCCCISAVVYVVLYVCRCLHVAVYVVWCLDVDVYALCFNVLL